MTLDGLLTPLYIFILPKQDSTHLVITVVDVNDDIPVFLDNEYYGTVREELPSGSTVTVVRDTCFSLNLQA